MTSKQVNGERMHTNALLSAFLLKSNSTALAFNKAMETRKIISSEAIN
ncbi:MAG: hypothetical protein LBP83_05310 [Dysgonamonadaceae bacterium]|nr:hypothetical protein [Dysgonamonadaceae bacterium]